MAGGMPEGISLDGRRLTIDGKLIELQQQAADIFARLMRSCGTPVHRQTIFFSCWGNHSDTLLKIVDIRICELRKALSGTRVEIETEWGFGYKLTVKDENEKLLSESRPSGQGHRETRKEFREDRSQSRQGIRQQGSRGTGSRRHPGQPAPAP